MKLSSTIEHYLLSKQIISPALINIVANGAISWVAFKNAELIRYWDAVPVGPDILLTGFLLPFIMAMINSRLIAVKVHAGEIERIPVADFPSQGWHQCSIFSRSFFLGVLGLLLLALPTVLILPLIWAEPLSLWGFVLFKALWAAVLTVLVCPVIAVWAIQSVSEQERDAQESAADALVNVSGKGTP